jgi:hypothetical protein
VEEEEEEEEAEEEEEKEEEEEEEEEEEKIRRRRRRRRRGGGGGGGGGRQRTFSVTLFGVHVGIPIGYFQTTSHIFTSLCVYVCTTYLRVHVCMYAFM